MKLSKNQTQTMNLFVFVLVFSVAILNQANSKLLGNNNRATPITCEPNSFNIETPFQPNVDNLEITIFYKLIPQPTLNLLNIDFRDYASTCLNNIVFMITPENRPSYIERKKLTGEYVLSGLIAQFRDLQPLTRYQFKIGYEQNSPYPQIVYIKDLVIETCFGEPGIPRNIRKNLNADDSITVVWDPPSVINAPSICFYLIEKRTRNTVNKYEQTGLSFKVTRNEVVDRTILQLSAYNDARCYQQAYPFVNKCYSNRTSSYYETIQLDSALLPATTSRPGGNGAVVLNGVNFLLFFGLFCFFIEYFY